MGYKPQAAKYYIGTPSVIVEKVDIKIDAAIKAIETGDKDLIVEWLVAYAPQRITTLATLRKFGEATVTRQARWAIACEINNQEWMKKLSR